MDALRLIQMSGRELEISRREVYRYMGCRNPPEDGRIAVLAEETIAKIGQESDCRCVYTRLPLEITGNRVSFPGFSTQSANLAKNLAGCGEIFLFAATIGIGFDRFLIRAQTKSPTSALIADCVGSAFIESFADAVNSRLEREAADGGLFLRPRFSPGYGDFPLSDQPALLGILKSAQKAGISLTDSGMMVPVKSVSALAGISPVPPDCPSGRCPGCTNYNCAYRA